MTDIRKPEVARAQQKMPGATMIGMVATLEAFVIALAAAEAPTRPDPKSFIQELKRNAVEHSNRFGSEASATAAAEYAEQLTAVIAAEAGIDMSDAK